MSYTPDEIMQYLEEEDVKFIRLTFCDVFGKQKNISVMPSEMPKAFERGIAIDASAIEGFGGESHSDLFLTPDPSNIAVLPWRPEHGRVVRMFCDINNPDGSHCSADTRNLLKNTVEKAKKLGYNFEFRPETEFYLFKRDADGEPTSTPYDRAGYMDIAPDDKGENVRREICLTLEQMGIRPESSHHVEGPGQNKIAFRYSEPLSAADNSVTFCTVVSTVAARYGLYADFSPKPLENDAGNGMHINISASHNGEDILAPVLAGILEHICDMTVFLNPAEASYRRFGTYKAPKYVSWTNENRSQLVRIPAIPVSGGNRRAELRSPDPMCNPYLAFSLLINAGIEGMQRGLALPPACNINMQTASALDLSGFKLLPRSLTLASECASNSEFIRKYLPEGIISCYCNR